MWLIKCVMTVTYIMEMDVAAYAEFKLTTVVTMVLKHHLLFASITEAILNYQ